MHTAGAPLPDRLTLAWKHRQLRARGTYAQIKALLIVIRIIEKL
jgi:hypothetical protein